MNRNRAIAQQVGQADTRLAGDLTVFGDPTSVAVRACSLPWTLGDQPQNRNSEQVNRAFDALLPLDPVRRDRLSPITS